MSNSLHNTLVYIRSIVNLKTNFYLIFLILIRQLLGIVGAVEAESGTVSDVLELGVVIVVVEVAAKNAVIVIERVAETAKGSLIKEIGSCFDNLIFRFFLIVRNFKYGFLRSKTGIEIDVSDPFAPDALKRTRRCQHHLRHHHCIKHRYKCPPTNKKLEEIQDSCDQQISS